MTSSDREVDLFGRPRERDEILALLDDGGRIVTSQLTDREIAEETLATMRSIADAISMIGANPAGMMARFMTPGISGAIASVQAAQNNGK